MREIRFRITLKNIATQKILQDYVTLDQLLYRNGCYWSPTWEIIGKDQYTGLKDKNGKEIYEGDIVVGFCEDGGSYEKLPNGVVGFNTNHSRYEVNNMYCLSDYHTVKVIGNVYEKEPK